MPNPSKPNDPHDEADAELNELCAANETLSAQVVSLTALLAERGMAEITRHQWADLSRVGKMDYVLGKYTIKTPHSDDPELLVSLVWEPGRLLLCESYQQTPENTLALPLPSVRSTRCYPVPSPPPGAIPPRPQTADQSLGSTTKLPAERMVWDKYKTEWETYLRPFTTAAELEQKQRVEAAAKDEEKLMYMAVQEIQDRRKDPKTPPGQTIGAMLELAAQRMRANADSSPS